MIALSLVRSELSTMRLPILTISPPMIAGVVTRVGDRVYDGSLKNQLAELEDELLDRNLYFNN